MVASRLTWRFVPPASISGHEEAQVAFALTLVDKPCWRINRAMAMASLSAPPGESSVMVVIGAAGAFSTSRRRLALPGWITPWSESTPFLAIVKVRLDAEEDHT